MEWVTEAECPKALEEGHILSDPSLVLGPLVKIFSYRVC